MAGNGNYHGTNRAGNDYTSYGGDRGNYRYKNQDGGRYYNAGPNQGSFYRNSDKGYQWYQNSSGDRSYQPYGNGNGASASGSGGGGKGSGTNANGYRQSVNQEGNSHTTYGPDRYSYRNQDGGRYYNAGPNSGAFYQNPNKGYHGTRIPPANAITGRVKTRILAKESDDRYDVRGGLGPGDFGDDIDCFSKLSAV